MRNPFRLNARVGYRWYTVFYDRTMLTASGVERWKIGPLTIERWHSGGRAWFDLRWLGGLIRRGDQ